MTMRSLFVPPRVLTRNGMLSKWDELRLIAQCVAGDNRSAFSRLVEEYQVGLRRFLLNLTLGDVALADDLAQDTFLKAYVSLHSFQGLSRFKTWLYRIAYNEYYNYIRKSNPETLGDKEPVGDGYDTWSATEAHIDMATCLKALNETERSIVLLFYLEDLPIKKISDIMKLPQGTVKSHLSRSKVKMAKVMNELKID